MKNILVLSQKGGTGKTTLADNIAFTFEAENSSVAFYNTDPQGGALHKTKEDDEADITVIDTAGVLAKNTKDMITEADLIVIPTQASALDMEPLNRIRGLVAKEAPATPVLIVINGWNRWTNAREFHDWLKESLRSTERIATLSQSEVVRRAAAYGESIQSFAPKSKSAAEVNAITNVLKELLQMEN